MSDITNQTFSIIGADQPASATGPDDYCSKIWYPEVDICHVHAYLNGSRRAGCCLPAGLFFGLPNCRKASYPIPTDAGLPKSLPALPLGYHYPQTSTDRTHGRSRSGIFAKERGKLYLAPWIQSTESVIITWDGIKRTWADADLLDDDPLLRKAVFEYLRWQHADKWDRDEAEAARAAAAYAEARVMLIHQCREETRARFCEPSHARSSPQSITNLYYNEAQSATATCADGETGTPVTVNIPAGTVASSISVADANQKAKAQALTQAQSQLDCTTEEETFTNDAQTATASCAVADGAPPPEGQPVTVTVPAGEVTSTISKADANAQALALAQTRAASQLSCTFWNAAQSYTATCTNNTPDGDVTKTVAAHTYSSTSSQASADALALADAKAQAEAALDPGCNSTGLFYNTQQQVTASAFNCTNIHTHQTCSVTVICTVAANRVTSIISQGDANQQAQNLGRQIAQETANNRCQLGLCGNFTMSI